MGAFAQRQLTCIFNIIEPAYNFCLCSRTPLDSHVFHNGAFSLTSAAEDALEANVFQCGTKCFIHQYTKEESLSKSTSNTHFII